MVEYLGAEEHDLRARLTHLMQVFVNAQERQIHAFADRYKALFDGEMARFAQAHEQTHPLTTDTGTVQGLNERAMQALRDTVNENSLGLREREAARAEEAMYNDPAYDTYVVRQAQQDRAISEAIDRMEHPPWLDYVPTEAEQRAYEDAPYDHREDLAHGNTDERDGRLDIDTSDPDMGTSWQQTLQQLQARLDSMEQEGAPQEQAQDHTRDAGMGY